MRANVWIKHDSQRNEKKSILVMQTQVEALFKFHRDWIINYVIQLQ